MNQIFRQTPPPVAEMTAFDMPALRRRRLDSGIEMIIYDGCDSAVNYLTLISPGGMCELPSAAVGALNAIMRREGTASFSGEEIDSALDFNGSWLRCNNMSHDFRISMYSLNSRLCHTLPYFKEMAFMPAFGSEALSVRREALARETEVSLSDVDYLAKSECDRMIMGRAHPLARTDSPDAIRAVSSADLSESFKAISSPENSILFLCGMITPEIEELVAREFSRLPEGRTRPQRIVTPFEAVEAGTLHVIDRPDSQQSAVVMAMPAIPRNHPDYIDLHIAVSALGGYFGSRLMLNIRERLGLTYGISAALCGMADGAYVMIQADTDRRHVENLRNEVALELDRLASEPPQGEELTRLRQSLLSSQAAVLDSPFSIIDNAITELTAAIPAGYFNAKLKAISALTPEKIAEVSAKYLRPANLRTVVAG